MSQKNIDYERAGKELREKAARAAENEAEVTEFADLIHAGTLASAQETAAHLRQPEQQKQAFGRIRQAQHDYQTESSGSSGEFLLKLAVLLDMEPHELLNPENQEELFAQLKTRSNPASL